MNKVKGDKAHILIVGSGSVGKRHATNLEKFGCRISCTDPRLDRVEELAAAVKTRVTGYSDIKEALSSDQFDGVVIGSPTKYHPEQGIIVLEAGIPVLMEKPIAITLKEALVLKNVASREATPFLLGYTWRWWEPLNRVRNLVGEGHIGKVYHVQFYMSAHLEDWHPWERYQDFFMSNKSLGGGALLDESHWIDLMIWFFGVPQSVVGKVEKTSDLDIETDDNVDFFSFYEDGKRIYVHLDLFGRPHERFIRFVGEKGTIYWSSEPNEIRISLGGENNISVEKFDCIRNDMFEAVAEEFLEMLSGKREETCSLEDGINTMKIIEAVRESSITGRCISVSK